MDCPDADCGGFAMATAIEQSPWIEVEIICGDCGKRWYTEVDPRDFTLEPDLGELRADRRRRCVKCA